MVCRERAAHRSCGDGDGGGDGAERVLCCCVVLGDLAAYDAGGDAPRETGTAVRILNAVAEDSLFSSVASIPGNVWMLL